MNLTAVLRKQFTQMNVWYKNALITNVVLDYLDLETDNAEENVKTVTALIDSKRVKIESKGKEEHVMIDGMNICTIYNTGTGFASSTLMQCFNLSYKYCIHYKDKDRKVKKVEDRDKEGQLIVKGEGKDG